MDFTPDPTSADARHGRPAEALPETFEPELHRLDGLLRTLAAEDSRPPLGMTDRIMAASRAMLPARPSVDATPAARRPVESAKAPSGGGASVIGAILGKAVWGRIAAAACAMLAVMVATQFWTAERAMRSEAGADIVLTGSTDWLTTAPEDEIAAEVSPFLESGSLGSLDELTSEMESMIAGLEM